MRFLVSWSSTVWCRKPRAAVVATVLFRDLRLLKPKMTKESMMTETMMNRSELLEKHDEGDFLRAADRTA